jgi:1,2-phenylacetyl-CoA epoxidase PaaB subunit
MFATYEVYADEGGEELTHVGSVRAFNEKLAVQAAQHLHKAAGRARRLRVRESGSRSRTHSAQYRTYLPHAGVLREPALWTTG